MRAVIKNNDTEPGAKLNRENVDSNEITHTHALSILSNEYYK